MVVVNLGRVWPKKAVVNRQQSEKRDSGQWEHQPGRKKTVANGSTGLGDRKQWSMGAPAWEKGDSGQWGHQPRRKETVANGGASL